jgi:hypothetical protein
MKGRVRLLEKAFEVIIMVRVDGDAGADGQVMIAPVNLRPAAEEGKMSFAYFSISSAELSDTIMMNSSPPNRATLTRSSPIVRITVAALTSAASRPRARTCR